MSFIKEKLNKLPKTPGVYYFYDKDGGLLYIGKAVSLRTRVGSYFQKNIYDNKTQALVELINDVKYKETDSVLEALILEALEIKKHLPPYNIRAKDDKTFVNIVITGEEFPRILVARPTENLGVKIKKTYGPYTSARSAREALKIIRKIIPFHSRKEHNEVKCLDFHLGLCPGPYEGMITKENYKKNIRRIENILQGKKTNVLRDFARDMKNFSSENRFEEAASARDKIFALKHIRDVSLLSADNLAKEKISNFKFSASDRLSRDGQISNKIKSSNNKNKKMHDEKMRTSAHRVEAYDISNISGKYAVGSMVVFEDGQIAKDEYRKFKIRTVFEANDIAMLSEVLERRFKHSEWKTPDIILMDGGKAQVNAAQKLVDKFFKISNPSFEKEEEPIVIGVAKGPTRKGLDLYFADSKTPLSPPLVKGGGLDRKLVAHIMSEAHRFAITYHRILRKKGFL